MRSSGRLVVAVLGLIAFVGLGVGSKKKAAPAGTAGAGPAGNAPAQPGPPPPAELQVSPDQLVSDYAANEVAGDAKYKEKVLEVQGSVFNIKKDLAGNPFVVLQTSHASRRVQVAFAAGYEAQLARLKQGDPVTVRGRCAGLMVHVQLKDGALIGQPVVAAMPEVDSTPITIPATALVGEYVANEVGADGKYKGRTLRVTGTIRNIKKDLGGRIFVVLEGGKSLRGVQVYFSASAAGQIAKLSKGNTITARGRCDGLMVNVQIKDGTLE